MTGEEGVFVESGAFLVDRSQALDKLMRFQLPNPAGFGLLLLRCAAAGGASFFSAETRGGTMVFGFDGRPFRREELADPYRCLFEKRAPETDRNRLLAVAFLSALRFHPERLMFESGSGDKRFALTVLSLSEERFQAPGAGDRTRLELSFSGTKEAAKLLREGAALSTLEVSLDGEKLPAWRARGPDDRELFEDGSTRGWVAVQREPGRESLLELYAQGALVERTALRLPIAQVHARLNDDEFVLNASQSGVVRDAVFKRALARLEAPTRALVGARAAGLARALPRLGPRLLDAALRKRWRDVLEAGRERPEGATVGAVIETAASLLLAVRLDGEARAEAAELEQLARDARWLRQLCVERLRRKVKRDDQVDLALRSAPLFVDARAAPLSFAELEEQRLRIGHVPFTTKPGAGLPTRALWAISAGEERLVGDLLGAPTRDATAIVVRERPGGGMATFEQAGLPAALIRASLRTEGTLVGEVGLSIAPEARARLHLLTEGAPSGLVEDPGPLRFDAVVTDGERTWSRDPLTTREERLCSALLEQAREQARGLYKRLAEEYELDDLTARGAAIRAHLFDYLTAELAARGPSAPPDESSWIAQEPLFREAHAGATVGLSWASLAGMGAMPIYSARQPQEQLWQDSRVVIVDPGFEPGLLARLFPDRLAAPLRERPGVYVLLRRLAEPCAACGQDRPAFAFRAGRETFHAACSTGSFSWERVSIHPSAQRSDPAFETAGHYELGLELLAAALRGGGPKHDEPGTPARRLVLLLLGEVPPPWSGPTGKALWSSLKGRPFFRSPGGGGRTLEDVFAALHAPDGRLTYASADDGSPADLILDAAELASLRRVEPLGAERLVRFGEAARVRAVRSAGVAEEGEPAASTFLSVFRGKGMIKPSERFFLERRYQAQGLDVWIGLPARLPAPKPAFVPRGESEELDLAAVPPLAYVLVDAAGWRAGGAPPTRTLMDLLRGFYSEAADRWPLARPETEHFTIAQRYLLEAALRSADAKAFPGWEPVRRKLFSLKLFRCVDGGWTSLDELREACAKDKVLRFADPQEPLPRSQGSAPVLRHARLVAELLGGVRTRRVKDAPLAAPPAAEPAAVAAPAEPPRAIAVEQPASEGAEVLVDRSQPPCVKLAHDLLLGLRGRKGLPRHECSSLRLVAGLTPTPLAIDEKGGWVLDAEHPLVAAVVDSPLSAEEQAAYLASIAYTAANRLKHKVSDEDDMRFQEALCAALLPAHP